MVKNGSVYYFFYVVLLFSDLPLSTKFLSIFWPQFKLCHLQQFFINIEQERHLSTKRKLVYHEKSAAGLCWCFFALWVKWGLTDRPFLSFILFLHLWSSLTWMDPHSTPKKLQQAASNHLHIFPILFMTWRKKNKIKFSRTDSYTSCQVQWDLKI